MPVICCVQFQMVKNTIHHQTKSNPSKSATKVVSFSFLGSIYLFSNHIILTERKEYFLSWVFTLSTIMKPLIRFCSGLVSSEQNVIGLSSVTVSFTLRCAGCEQPEL